MDYVTTVRLLIRETRQALPNVKVELFDRDEHSPDDSLGTGQTNSFGEVTFKYSTSDFADSALGVDDEGVRVGGSRDTVPDLYPVVYDTQGQVVISRRDEATRNKAALHILVLIDEAVARAHQLSS